MWKKWLWKQNKEILFIITFSCLLGFIISSKLSFIMQHRMKNNFWIFPLKYSVFVVLGGILYLFISSWSWEEAQNKIPKLFFFFIFLTLLTIIVGKKINGVRRWIFLGPISLQSSEFLKVVTPYMTAKYLSEDNHLMSVISIFVSCALLLLQPDLGMTILLLTTCAAQIFLVKKNLKLYAKILGSIIVLLFISGIFLAKYAKKRILIFLGKEQGYQITQGLKSLKKSTIFGVPSSVYIPDSHCDFVFTEICSFFGIIVAIMVIILPLILSRVVRKRLDENFSQDPKQIFLLGLFIQYNTQSYIHILSNLAIIPTKGMNLPLISFGGSNVICYFMLFGLVASIVNKKDYSKN